MYDAVQLRLASTSALLCAVLAAATLSGAHRAGPPASAMDLKSAPILVKSISTTWKVGLDDQRASVRHVVTTLGEARLGVVPTKHEGER